MEMILCFQLLRDIEKDNENLINLNSKYLNCGHVITENGGIFNVLCHACHMAKYYKSNQFMCH